MMFVDDREKSCEVVEELGKLGIRAEIKRLKCGDYVDDELGLCIERKNIDDFCGSIKNGRLKSQVNRMVEDYEVCFVLVEGDFKNRSSDIHINCILGMMTSLVMKGVGLVQVADGKQMAFVIKKIVERLEEENSVI